MGTGTLARRERAALANLLDARGPDAPTLCAGWTTRELVAHLVLRESHPAATGIAFPPLARWTESKQRALAEQPYPSLVARFRGGPPLISPLRLPKADSLANTFEHFVHQEDVRRAVAGWEPRPMTEPDQGVLWSQLRGRLRLFVRRAPVAVRVLAPGFGEATVGDADAEDTVTLTGPPGELVLYLHGRRDQAQVEVSGSDSARAAWAEHALRV
jgi:uncharacterized protein (TIGR03085 family)